MRRSPRLLVRTWLAVLALGLGVLPAINLTLHAAPSQDVVDRLFRIDFLLRPWHRALVSRGLSPDPQAVLLGHPGWMFLGDAYDGLLSAKRLPVTPQAQAAHLRIARASRAWAAWMQAQGVRDFRILLCPDKDSIETEALPAWARGREGGATDDLMRQVDPALWIDGRPALREARRQGVDGLYSRTDSHWTARGAWFAYRALARAALPGPWLEEADVRLLPLQPAPTGDLPPLLHVADPPAALDDIDAPVGLGGPWLAGRQVLWVGQLRPVPPAVWRARAPLRAPMWLLAPQARASERVLWVRDSSGTALLDLMSASFSQVLQTGRSGLTPAGLAGLVQELRPDRVYISVVERQAGGPWFEAGPPGLPTP